jgi:ubiquinone biosynthesis protein UbiJ
MTHLPTDARLAQLIRAFEIRIEGQIEVVAQAVCDGLDIERPAKLLSRLTKLHVRLKAEQ